MGALPRNGRQNTDAFIYKIGFKKYNPCLQDSKNMAYLEHKSLAGGDDSAIINSNMYQ